MADGSKIEWTDATWNPVTGCSVVSAGCTNCYAMRLAGTRLRNHPSRAGLTSPSKAGPVWNGQVRLNEEWLDQPLRWSRPRTIFVCAHGDLFHEAVPDSWLDRVFTVMALAPQHRFQVLTKRADRMRAYLTRIDEESEKATAQRLALAWPGKTPVPPEIVFPLANVWLGVSVEDQRAAEQRVPDLIATPAQVRFLSCEPLLGPVDLTFIDLAFQESREAEPSGLELLDALTGIHYDGDGDVPGVIGSPDPHVDWVIVGGESGPGSRPMRPEWAQSLRDQCAAANVPFFFKQWGDHVWVEKPDGGWLSSPLHVGKADAGRLLDGVEHNGMPR